MEPLRQVYQTYIRTTPERLWQALTSGELTKHYYYGADVKSTWQPGAPILYDVAGRGPMIQGEIIEADPPRKLAHTFKALWTPAGEADPPSRVTYEIEALGPSCRLTLIHEHVAGETQLARMTGEGWNLIVAGLKTYLETGEALVVEEPEAASVS